MGTRTNNTNPNDTEKPVLREEVYVRALRAIQNRKEVLVLRTGGTKHAGPSKMETVHELKF
jgi:hypothetical protein